MATKTQFAQALQSSAEAGYPIILNVMTCCRGCATEKDAQKAYNKQAKEFDLPALTLAEDDPSVVWHFGGQGNEIVFSPSGGAEGIEEDECDCYDEDDEYDEDEDGNETLVREGEFIECRICREGPRRIPLGDNIYLGHSTDEAARSAVESLKAAGFEATWNGSRDEAIQVSA